MTPTVRPPRDRAPAATAPIAETLPPPDTSVQPRSAIAAPDAAGEVEQFGVARAGRAVHAHRPLAARIRGHIDKRPTAADFGVLTLPVPDAAK